MDPNTLTVGFRINPKPMSLAKCWRPDDGGMKQSELVLNLTTNRTRKREFLGEMERVVPWADLVALIAPYAPEGKRGRPPFAVEAMLRIHFMQQWYVGMKAHIGLDVDSGKRPEG